MAFTSFTAAQITIGEANKKELWDKTKDNFDDHESRLLAVEAGTSSPFPLQFLVLGGGVVVDEAAFFKLPFDITITSVELTVMKAGSSGSMEVDILTNQSGSFATVFNTGNLTLSSGSGDLATASAPSFAVTDIDEDKFFRLDIKAVQTGARDYQITIGYTVR